eukprot:4546798-Amphidinium_carterae.1
MELIRKQQRSDSNLWAGLRLVSRPYPYSFKHTWKRNSGRSVWLIGLVSGFECLVKGPGSIDFWHTDLWLADNISQQPKH